MKNYLLLVVASTFILIANPCHAIKQGGDAIVSYKEDVVTLDPAIGYYSELVDYKIKFKRPPADDIRSGYR